MVKVLVVDDSVLYRKVLTEILMGMPGIEVVGTAGNGKIALQKIELFKPDILTLDIEMPVMNGIETLRAIRGHQPAVTAIMVSAHTREGAAITMEALQLGAYDFITKPEAKNPEQSRDLLTAQLKPLIHAVAMKKGLPLPSARDILRPDAEKAREPVAAPPPGRIEVVAIGISTGGPDALAQLLPSFPRNLRVPILIVQHMPAMFTAALAETLDKKCAISVVEGQHGQKIRPGTAYIAPGGKQMRIEKEAHFLYDCLVEITSDPPENHCQPAVDYLFRSVAKVYQNHALGVIMTGMGSDGTKGLRLMKRQGAQVLAQDEKSCVVFGMPGEAVKAGVTDAVVPLNGLGHEIMKRI